VSVLVTNYNYIDFLPAALDSALHQSEPALEVIVVDDGSTDGSAELVRERYGDQVRLVAKPNGGQASAFNAGFAACRGDVVCLLDADDRWEPDKIAAVSRAFAEHPEAAMVRHEIVFDRPGGDDHGAAVLGLTEAVWPQKDPARGLLDRRYGPTSALAFPRWVLQRLLPMPETDFRICADAYLFLLAPTLGPVVDLSARLGRYRIHGSNNYAADQRAAERALAVELLLVRLLSSRGADPVVPHYVYREARRLPHIGSELLRRRDRLRRTLDCARGSGSAPVRAARALREAVGRETRAA
jgi:glycosyltransferase involved in cell wall biosynthesis